MGSDTETRIQGDCLCLRKERKFHLRARSPVAPLTSVL